MITLNYELLDGVSTGIQIVSDSVYIQDVDDITENTIAVARNAQSAYDKDQSCIVKIANSLITEADNINRLGIEFQNLEELLTRF